ncbi:MAG TPA: UvrB/UvrC motif-containing protein [Phycisphaerae bacterium]|nr:UvrB/UvrC motif-containing protein [Phycisphaerae bacterium]
MGILCQSCKNAEATVHVTDIAPSNGEKRERHLCEGCAEEEGITMKQHEPINTILAKFVEQKVGGSAEEAAKLTCPKCGVSFREFRANGLLGCRHDYEVFAEYITPLIERAHGGATQHAGKVPRRMGSDRGKQTDILRLKRRLSEAVEKEDYETAAAVRDELKVLQGDGN